MRGPRPGRRGRSTPAASTGTVVPPSGPTGLQHGVVLHGRAHDGAPPRRRARPSTARLSASVPPAVKTTSPGSHPRHRGDVVAGLVDGQPGARGPRRAMPDGLPKCSVRIGQHGRQRLRPHRAWSRRGRGRPAISSGLRPTARARALHRRHGLPTMNTVAATNRHRQRRPRRPPPDGSRDRTHDRSPTSRRPGPPAVGQLDLDPPFARPHHHLGQHVGQPTRGRGPTTTKPSPTAKAPWLAATRAKPNTGTPYSARPAQLTPGGSTAARRRIRRRRAPPGPAGLDPGHGHGPEADDRAQDVEQEQDAVGGTGGHGVDRRGVRGSNHNAIVVPTRGLPPHGPSRPGAPVRGVGTSRHDGRPDRPVRRPVTTAPRPGTSPARPPTTVRRHRHHSTTHRRSSHNLATTTQAAPSTTRRWRRDINEETCVGSTSPTVAWRWCSADSTRRRTRKATDEP